MFFFFSHIELQAFLLSFKNLHNWWLTKYVFPTVDLFELQTASNTDKDSPTAGGRNALENSRKKDKKKHLPAYLL